MPGSLADEAVHVGAHAGRRRAADVVRRRHQHVVDAVEVGLGRVLEPVGEVVDARPGRTARPAFSPYMIERGSVEKLRSSMIRPRRRDRDRDVGEDVEDRHDRLAVVQLHELRVAPRLRHALVGRPADVEERGVVGRRRRRHGDADRDAVRIRRRRRAADSRPSPSPARSTVCSAPAQAGGGTCGMIWSPLPMLMSSSRVTLYIGLARWRRSGSPTWTR